MPGLLSGLADKSSGVNRCICGHTCFDDQVRRTANVEVAGWVAAKEIEMARGRRKAHHKASVSISRQRGFTALTVDQNGRTAGCFQGNS